MSAPLPVLQRRNMNLAESKNYRLDMKFLGYINAKILPIYIILILLALFALLYNLGDRYLWGDEAETALLGINITKYGVPKITDGKNFIMLNAPGYDYNEDLIWTWSPWLDEYIVAGSFLVFGKSTFSARLPFAVLGFLSFLSMLYIARRIYNKHETAIIAGLLLVTNIAFLLHVRQCRYYAVVMLAQLWLIYGYKLLISGRPKSGIALVVAALTAQFYCNYIFVFGNIVGLGICTILIRRKHRHLIVNMLTCFGIFVVLVIPWLAYAKFQNHAQSVGISNLGYNILFYISSLHFYFVALPVLLIKPATYAFERLRSPKTERKHTSRDIELLLWLLIPIQLIVTGLMVGAYFRYILSLLPVAILLASTILVNHIRVRSVRYAFIGILCLSNLTAVLTAYPIIGSATIQMPFVRFIQEITSNYEDRTEDVVSYLRKNGNPNESIFVHDPEFPLIFYTDMRIIDARFKTTRTISKDDMPDWIFPESACGVFGGLLIQLSGTLLKYYEPVRLTVHDSDRSGNRPDPHVHIPFTTEKFTEMVIYKRIHQTSYSSQEVQ